MKQDLLAQIMGNDWDQAKISRLEAKEEIPEDVLEEVSKALHVTPEAIKNFSEEMAFNFINSTVKDSQFASYISTNSPTYNSVDPIIELFQKSLEEHNALIRQLLEKLSSNK